MRLATIRVHDLRSVHGAPVEVVLGSAVTVLVGPNLAGKSNLARALAVALDERVPFEVDRERPRGRPDSTPTVELTYHDRDHGRAGEVHVRVAWPLGQRVVDVRPQVPVPDGRPVLAWADDRPADVLARVADQLDDTDPDALAAELLPTLRRVLPEVGELTLPATVGGDVVVVDRDGFALGDHTVRATFAAALAAHLARRGVDLPGVVVEEPEAFLHPGAQEALREELLEVGVAADAPVVITTESPFMVPRVPEATVVAVARDVGGATRVVGSAHGGESQAPLLGGLFRDTGIAEVLDRTASIPAGVRGVLVVEGGTDEAYLRTAARVLGRPDEVASLAIRPAGGAMPAAVQAVVLRAETDLPVLVLLDNDDAGRRAKDTLVRRFGFTNRTEVATYAEVVPDHPLGTEAEDLFDWRLVERFAHEAGPQAVHGRRPLREGEWHHDLGLAAKSAFVSWVDAHATPDTCARWGTLLDLLGDRLDGRTSSVEQDR